MDNRLELHEIFCGILGSRNVYFQPPASVQMKYPAIVYSRKPIRNTYANNAVYKQATSYEVTVIDEDPDSKFVEEVSKLPTCRHDRYFTSDNLNHDVFTLFY